LQAEEDSHQKFLEHCYSTITLIAGVVGAIFIFFNMRTYRDVRMMIKQRINAVAEQEVEAALAKVKTEAENAKQIANQAIKEFNDHLATHRKIVEQQVKALESEFKGSVHNSIMLATALARTCALLSQPKSGNPKEEENTNQERRDTIEKLKEIQTNWAPTNRTIIVFIGRLYRQLGDLNSAIQAIDKVLTKRADKGENKGQHAQDHSDILFNKACYLNLEASKTESVALREEAWRTISESVRIWPPNLDEAKKDEDLDGLTNDVRVWANLQRQ